MKRQHPVQKETKEIGSDLKKNLGSRQYKVRGLKFGGEKKEKDSSQRGPAKPQAKEIWGSTPLPKKERRKGSRKEESPDEKCGAILYLGKKACPNIQTKYHHPKARWPSSVKRDLPTGLQKK